jgi:extracellular elastinolytic metalloproteinase
MRRHLLRRFCALAATTILTSAIMMGTASAAPIPSYPVQGDMTGDGDVDNRAGATQPSDQQRAAASERSTTVRWNRYGAPATLVPRADLQRRDAADPVAVARRFLTENLDAFGISLTGIGAMEVLVSRPMGQGAYVLLRQRFGDQPALVDGLAAFGIRDGAVVYLSSTISPERPAPDLTTRSFRIKPTVATHLMIRVLTNQCTGGPDYAGDRHNDPRSTSDCTTGNPEVAQTVRISELQAFTS